MPSLCSTYALSDDYADFIVEYSLVLDDIGERFSSECIYPVNDKFAIVHTDLNNVTSLSINSYSYNEIPKCYGLMDITSIDSTGAIRLRREPNLSLYGRGVIIGFIDTGINYTNPLFTNADDTSRILSIWDQSEPSSNINNNSSSDISSTISESAPYGRVYTNEDINRALASSNPYSIVSQQDEENGHGTFMAAIAAGNEDNANDFTGMAPYADIAVVKLKQAKKYLRDYNFIPDNISCYQENDIMMGINFLVDIARVENKPLVICLGVGSNSGDHNGRSYLEQYIDLVADSRGVVVITAGGNEVNSRHHYLGTIDYSSINPESEEVIDNVELRVDSNENGFILELWVTSPNSITVGFLSPSGESVSKISPRPRISQRLTFLFDRTTIYLDSKIIEESTGDQLVSMRFDTPSAGIWTILVYFQAKAIGEYNMWLPINNFIGNDTFFVKSDPDMTLCAPANCLYSITTSGYNHTDNSIFINSSRGYTRYGRVKPDIAAPAVNVYGPGNNGFERRSGTSIAAAHTAGGAALFLEWSIVLENDPAIDSIKLAKYLIRGASRDNSRVYPNKEWGWGKLDLYGGFDVLRGNL